MSAHRSGARLAARAAAFSLGLWLAAPAVWAEPSGSCALALALDADEADSRALREELSAGLLGGLGAAGCGDARVSLARSAGALLVTVDRGGRRVSREVASLAHAALWVESWLLPVEALPAEATEPEPPAAQRAVEVRLELLAAASLTGDLSIWTGPELSVAALLTRAFWLGGGLGLAFWSQADQVSRINYDLPVVRISLRLGGRLGLGERLALDLGGGVGFTGDSQMDQPVNPFVELLVELEVRLGRGFTFDAGLLGRAHVIEDANRGIETTTAALFAGELRLGLAYTFGRRR